jgi:hypothetical protein
LLSIFVVSDYQTDVIEQWTMEKRAAIRARAEISELVKTKCFGIEIGRY